MPALILWLLVAWRHRGFGGGADILLAVLWGAGLVMAAANLTVLVPH